MNLYEFEKEFISTLGVSYKTKDIDKFSKKLIKERVDVSFLKNIVLEKQQYHRIYFQVSLGLIDNIDDKLSFIENNFELLQDWWHTDQLTVFLGNDLKFDVAYNKAKEYVKSELPFVRRFGYVMFIPRLVKEQMQIEQLIQLLHNDTEYYVVMGEAWLISYFAMYHAEMTYNFLKECDLDYNIIGKAIQKICDSYVVSTEYKVKFKSLRILKK